MSLKSSIEIPTAGIIFRRSARVFALAFVVACTSCVSLITPEKAPFSPDRKTASPVGITVNDQRKNVSGGLGINSNRYYGRCRLGLYGIPTPISDPAYSMAERVTKHLEAGFKAKGVEVRTLAAGDQAFAGTGASKVLEVTLNDDTWIDFANPMTGNESILYFNATARVLTPSGKSLATATRKIERNFRYDANDSLFNQALVAFQPEFNQLINQPSIRAALAP